MKYLLFSLLFIANSALAVGPMHVSREGHGKKLILVASQGNVGGSDYDPGNPPARGSLWHNFTGLTPGKKYFVSFSAGNTASFWQAEIAFHEGGQVHHFYHYDTTPAEKGYRFANIEFYFTATEQGALRIDIYTVELAKIEVGTIKASIYEVID